MAQIRWFLVAAGLLVVGCKPASTPPPPPVTSPPVVSPDLKGLQRLITVPRRPVSVMWEYTQIGDGNMGPSDLQVLAVIQYTPTDADAIEKAVRKQGGMRKGEVTMRSWFPINLRKKSVSGNDGSRVLRGDKLDASTFAHLSLQNGFAMRVPDTPYFVVSLSTT